MRIARINLDLEVPRRAVLSQAGKFDAAGLPQPKGTAHRYFVRAAFRRNPVAYVARVLALVRRGVDAGAEIIQLPATSLLVSAPAHVSLDHYTRGLPRSAIVVAGVLDCARLGHKGDHREGSIAVRGRQQLAHFARNDHMVARAGLINGLLTVLAVSSTIRQVRADGWLDDHQHPRRRRSRILALDLGHEQYSGRYTMTLRAVHDRLCDANFTPAVLLSQWRYANGSRAHSWALLPTGSRITAIGDGTGEAGPADEIDLIDIPRWR